MVESPRIELVEIDVEQLSYVPGHRADALGRARRWWDAAPAVIAEPPAQAWPTATVVRERNLAGSASFWRIVDVPGNELGRVLETWWSRASHDDGHLCLSQPSGGDGTWQLGGSLRTTMMSRRVAVDVRLSSYARFWSMLELSPRGSVRPTRLYFRIGHDSLDLFVAALRALT